MTRQVTRQIAFMTLFSGLIILVLLTVASGLNVDSGAVATQGVPLAVACAAALTVLLIDPFDSRL
jgi:hypothetical protein